MKFNMTVENMSLIIWWLYASYNVHWDRRVHSGAMISLGKGDTVINYNNQKLNVYSYNE